MVEVIYKGTGAVKKQVISYLHSDHLNTPRLATNDAQTTVWRWESTAFGAGKAELNPDGDKQKVVINLRFPGQYYDSESGLHYNYYRDYDPRTGRYIQSDPIGLEGGLNTYGYVSGNPLSYSDPLGLFTFSGGFQGNYYDGAVVPFAQGLSDFFYDFFVQDAVDTASNVAQGNYCEAAVAATFFAAKPAKIFNKVTREDRWIELANQNNSRLPKEVIDHINRHNGKGLRDRFGLELAHKPRKFNAQGYDYSEAIPRTSADHRGIEHRYLKERTTGTTISMPRKKRGNGKLSLPPKGALP